MKKTLGIITALMIGASSAMADITSGLVAHYEFEGNANDSSGNANHGIENSGVSYTTGKIGQAASFDGNSYIRGNAFSMNSNNFSVSSWIKLDDTCSNVNAIFALPSHTNTDDAIHIDYKCDMNALAAYVFEDQRYFSNTLDIKNSWSHIVVVKNGSTLTMYADSVKLNEFQVSSNIDYGTVRSFLIGADDDYSLDGKGDTHWFTGLIDDLRIYNRALTSSEVNELYSGECNDRYDEGYAAGKAYCQSNPSACGISTGGNTIISNENDISINITSGWQLAGASGSIDTNDFAAFFESACVSEVYYFNNSWYHYVPNGSLSGLIDIGPDQGFWINGKKSCTLSILRYTEEQCNLSYPSMSADDKAWCDATYY